MSYASWKNTLVGALCLVLVVLLSACQGEQHDWQEHDLMSQGLPVKIQGPEDLSVKRSSFSGAEEFELSGDGGYHMNVFVMDASSGDAKSVTNELRGLIEKGTYFADMELDEAEGFVYRIEIDSTHTVYGFRKVVIQGAKQIVFQSPTMSRLTKDQAMALYAALP